MVYNVYIYRYDIRRSGHIAKAFVIAWDCPILLAKQVILNILKIHSVTESWVLEAPLRCPANEGRSSPAQSPTGD